MKFPFCFGLFLLSLPFVAASSDQPNIILIFTDDHGWPDIGAAGVYDDLKTPNIDRLAADGVRCTSGYVTAPQCVPSRGGLLVGRDQSRFGLETNGSGLEGFNAELTIADRLKELGYATGQIGKWHLGAVQQITDHGFDDVYAKNSNRPGWVNFGLDGSDREPGPEHDGLYHLDACSAAATAFIERHAEEPFFLYLAYRAPHVPLDAPEKYLSRFPGKMPERRRQALAMISAMDDGVGAIREKLAKKGLSENTLIFFIGDNGAPLKIHKLDAPGGGPGWDGSLNAPMNGEKGMLSEGGIRVPFVVAWPEVIPGGQVVDTPVTSLDVAATAVALAGGNPDVMLDGVDLVPFLKRAEKTLPREALFWRWSSQSAIREGRWKLLKGGSREYLFDLHADAGESTNLIGEKQELAKRLKKKLETWTGKLEPPGFIGDKMPQTWETYFDFYLDGKEVPIQKATAAVPSAGGWIARNAELTIKDGVLRVHDLNGKQRHAPFLANNKVQIKGPFRIAVTARLDKPDGNLSVSWRCQGEDDFVFGNTIRLEAVSQGRFEALIPEDRTVIHLRLMLPEGNATIPEIQAQSQGGDRAAKTNLIR